MKTPRVTTKYLIDWINTQWESERIGFEVTEIYRTNFTQDQYEGGAARLIIKYEPKELDLGPLFNRYFYSFDTISYLNSQLKDGYELFLKYDERHYLNNTILTTRKQP